MNPLSPDINSRRFVTAAEKVDVISPWTLEEWLCRSDIVPNQELLMVRANMEAGRSHPFHTHPTREEIIYIISGRAGADRRTRNRPIAHLGVAPIKRDQEQEPEL